MSLLSIFLTVLTKRWA